METKIWFTSDTHFGGERTLKLSKRPFQTVEEMDRVLINNWNSLVNEDDIVYHLGDFGDYTTAEKLNGYINLITGNYERFEILKVRENAKRFNMVYRDKCDCWIEYRKEGEINNYHLSMSHEPSIIKEDPISSDHINLFGHIHKLCMVKPYGLNVGTDCHNFCPINLETVLFYHVGILDFYDYEVFE